MQAATNRLPRATRHRRPEKTSVTPQLALAGDTALLAALPIAAAIFCEKDGKLWVESMNPRFLDLAGCGASPEMFLETFKHYAKGPGGTFTLQYLANPTAAPDELEYAEGEGVGRRFLRL